MVIWKSVPDAKRIGKQFNYKAGNGSGAEVVGVTNTPPLHERSKNSNNPFQV